MISPKLNVLAVCAFGATPLFAAGPTEPTNIYWLHDAHYIGTPKVQTGYDDPLTLAEFLEWTAVSYPTAENVIVLDDRTLQIGNGVYDN